MLGHIFLSQSAFRRLLQIRILGELRPEDEPSDLDGQPCYLDGLELLSVDFDSSPERPRQFELNRPAPAGTGVEPVGMVFDFAPLRAIVSGRVLFVSATALRTAAALGQNGRFGLPQQISKGFAGLELDIFLDVTDQGVPVLRVELAPRDDLPDFIRRLGNLSVAMPMATAFGEALEPGRTRVLNAGITFAGGDLALRFEFEQAASLPGDAIRAADWQSFLTGNASTRLRPGQDHWAIELPTAQIMAKAARELDESMGSADVRKYFTPTQNAWGVWEQGQPGFTLHKPGVFESLCSGLDVKAELTAKVSLSVPADNTLRQSVELEIDVDNVDAWKCIGVSLVNPLAGLITLIDHVEVVPWWAVLPGTLIWYWPALAMVGWGLGLDEVGAKLAIEEAQKTTKPGKPAIVRTSFTTFYTETSKTVQTAVTRDWLVLEDVSADGDRLVLRGDFTAPDLTTLPRLVGTLVEPFADWWERDRCSTHPTLATLARVALTLEDAAGNVVADPIVPVRYGIDIEIQQGKRVEVGQATWRIVGPSAADFEYPGALTTWTGIPGTFEIERRGNYEAEAGALPTEVSLDPSLRLRFFTGHGVREFRVPPPAPVPTLTPAQAQARAIERANDCKIFSSLIHRVKALQVFWLPRPPEGLAEGQHWQVVIGGLGQGRRVRAWDVERAELLAEVSSAPGVTELSLVVPAERAVRTLQLTLDETPLMDQAAYRREASAVVADGAVAGASLVVRQTPLYRTADGAAVEVYRRGRTRDAWPLAGRGAQVRELQPTARAR